MQDGREKEREEQEGYEEQNKEQREDERGADRDEQQWSAARVFTNSTRPSRLSPTHIRCVGHQLRSAASFSCNHLFPPPSSLPPNLYSSRACSLFIIPC